MSVLPVLKLKLFPTLQSRKNAHAVASSRKQDADPLADPAKVFDRLLTYDTVSFDLFDTLVWRRIALQDVHRKTSEFADTYFRGDEGPLPKGLIARSRHRLQQEVQARVISASAGARNEVDLSDVFDAALLPHISDAKSRQRVVEALIAYEVETEAAVLVVDPAMRDLVVRLRAAGKQLILISDMYLTAENIDTLLRALGLRDLFDHVFVSATVGVTKASGKMFAHVDRKLGLTARARVHIGDNLHSDVHRARDMGWHALHYRCLDHEARREERDIRARLGSLGHAAAFRALRKEYGLTGEQYLEQLAAAGFSRFARRVLARAIEGRFDRVLFLTRDGTGFRKAIEAFLNTSTGESAIVCPPLGDLAISRRAGALLNYPEMHEPGWQQYLEWNVRWLNHTPLSFRTIMRTYSIRPEDLEDLSADLQAEAAAYLVGDDPSTDLGFSKLRDRPDLLLPLHSALIARRNRVRAYLAEVGLTARDERILLVDIGYSGSAMKSITEYMFASERNGQPIKARLELMMLAANRYHDANQNQMHPRVTCRPGELIDVKTWRHRAAGASFAWLEPFVVDRTRGALRDYEQDHGGRMVPVFAPAKINLEQDALAQRIKGHISQYERALRRSPLPIDEADRRMTDLWMSEVVHPGSRTVRAMQQHRHHGGQGEVREQEILMRIRPHRMISDIFRCIESDRWLQGSLRHSGLAFITPIVNVIVALESK